MISFTVSCPAVWEKDKLLLQLKQSQPARSTLFPNAKQFPEETRLKVQNRKKIMRNESIENFERKKVIK